LDPVGLKLRAAVAYVMKRNQIAVFRFHVIPVPERLDIFDFLTFINGVGQLPTSSTNALKMKL
jgi:hypothetical protein